MAELFAIEAIPLLASETLALSRQLLMIKEQDFTVQLSDGPITMAAKWLMVNIFVWRPLIKHNMPIERRHTICDELVTKERLAEVQTEIYNDVVTQYERNTGTMSDADERIILFDLCETIDDLHAMVSTQLGAYHLSISAFEFCELLDHPEIAELTKVDISEGLQMGIAAAEAQLKEAGAKIMKKLEDDTIPHNIIAPFLKLGLLSPQQLPQVMMALGFRTDASSMTIRYPILSSYVTGMQNIKEFAIESMGAKKSVYYNRNAMPESQYNSRKQQLLASTVQYLHRGDCGSTVTIPYHINTSNFRNVVHKNIVEQGRLITLTKKNIGSYIGHTVAMRSPLTCRHTDGICHVCGGRLTDFMPPHSVVGISSAVEYLSAASQLVLSAKHYSKTSSIAYTIPEALVDFLIVRQNDIFIHPKIDVSNIKIGIHFRDVPHINELVHAEEERDALSLLNEQQFSNINYVLFARISDDMPLTGEVAVRSGDMVPYFSSEMVSYIKDNLRSVEIGDMVWIPLKRFDHQNEPLMRCVIESNSMIRFNQTLARFATSDIRGYTSLAEVLRDFTQIVYREINTNIMHIEVVLKSYLVTNDDNYDIPLVTDINAVQFSDLESIIRRRSLGAQFAFERLVKFLASAETYTMPHKKGIFDVFFYPD